MGMNSIQINEQRAKHLVSIGLNGSDVKAWNKKYRSSKENALLKKREYTLSFEDYTTKVAEAGITSPSQIGRTLNQYQLGRLGDDGGYTIDNCRFITMAQNKLEQLANGKYVYSESFLANQGCGGFMELK